MIALLNSQKFRDATQQIVFAGVVLGLVGTATIIGKANLDDQGITSGFDFLDRATGFEIGFSLIKYTPFDTYGDLLLVGLLNTILLGIIGIVLANIVGIVVAVLRISANPVMKLIGTVYIETFRNVPLILQVFFWYSVLTHLPRPKQAYEWGELIFLSGRGLYLPGLNVDGGAAAAVVLLTVAALAACVWIATARRFSKMAPRRKIGLYALLALSTLLVCGILIQVGRLEQTPFFSVPELRGLNFRGGIMVPPELSAMAVSMAVYGGAYLAEVFRAGFISVGRGQIEAARALGLGPWHVFSRVRLPLAVRAVLPSLTNLYVWLFKATTLGIAIGFTDFFSVISVSINQSGQTLELIGLLMLAFLIMNNTMSTLLNRVNKAIALKGANVR